MTDKYFNMLNYMQNQMNIILSTPRIKVVKSQYHRNDE